MPRQAIGKNAWRRVAMSLQPNRWIELDSSRSC
jgi:hypothetical protein